MYRIGFNWIEYCVISVTATNAPTLVVVGDRQEKYVCWRLIVWPYDEFVVFQLHFPLRWL